MLLKGIVGWGVAVCTFGLKVVAALRRVTGGTAVLGSGVCASADGTD